jgi:excisionase family DNA binding protein
MVFGGLETDKSTEPALITAQEVSRMLKISTRTLWRLLSAHKVPEPIRLGGLVRWRHDDLKNWIAAGCPPMQSRENERWRT